MRTVLVIQREIDALEQERDKIVARLSALHSEMTDAMLDEVNVVEGYLYHLGREWTVNALNQIAEQLRQNPSVLSATVTEVGLYVKQKVDRETWRKINTAANAPRSAGLAPDEGQ